MVDATDKGIGAANTQPAARAGALLLWLPLAIVIAASSRNLTGPWEIGMRGQFGSRYSEGTVANTLEHGLGVTLGIPTMVTSGGSEVTKFINWHHPPLYWLYLTGFAWLLGNETWVLRCAHLLLFLPGFAALYWLVRNRVDPFAAGLVVLLFATSPLVAHFGPMVLQDGAVLSFGLVTMWAFDRYLASRTWRNWWLTALLFFVVTSLDIPGYFWGVAMFALALTETERWRAVRSVLSFFPVSLAAFATTAIHYGLVLGGPVGYIEAMLGLADKELVLESGAAYWHRVWVAIDEVLIGFYSGGVLLLAVVGLLLSAWARTHTSKRLVALGVALAVPGIINYTAFFAHALVHPFWSVHGFAGIAALAAIAAIGGLNWWQAGGRRRVAGTVLSIAVASTIVGGAIGSHALLERYAPDFSPTSVALRRVAYLFGGCAIGMTNGPIAAQEVFGVTSFHGSVDSAQKLEVMLGFGRGQNYSGHVVFVLLPGPGNDELAHRLDCMAESAAVDDLLVYRFKL